MARWLALALALLAGTVRADTVVFIEGLGGGPRAFAEVTVKLHGTVPVFFHPRPKQMQGDEDGIRTPTEAARDLRTRLQRGGLEPPFLLVGHSLGGAQAMAFAHEFRDEVSGVLLLDPRLPGYTPECRAARQNFCDFSKEGLAKRPPQQRREYLGLAADAERLRDAAFLGDIPLIVMGAAKPAPGLPADWQAFWLDHLQRFTATAPKGRFIAVPDSGHMIQKQVPDRVAEEIGNMLGLPAKSEN